MMVFYVILPDPHKKTIKGNSQGGSLKIEESTKLFEGLSWGTRSYVMNPKFSTSTSLPIYFYLGYQVLQENEEFMKVCGKVSSFYILSRLCIQLKETMYTEMRYHLVY